MREKWMLKTLKADFNEWAEALSVSPVFARILRNRGIESVEEARRFLYGTVEELSDPYLLKDMAPAIEVISEAISNGRRIAISSDYDDDGIFSARILLEGFRTVGGDACVFSPNRMTEGYGINRRIIDAAHEKGCSLIVTCDNGIAAYDEILYAKEKGFSVVVTDHHEIPYDTADGEKRFCMPPADAVVDPKRADSEYPFRELCGAGVAFRLIQALYRRFGIPKEKDCELYEYVAIATVADVVPLTGENRILVRAGIEALHHTKKVPLLALIEACSLKKEEIRAIQVGFVIGPSFNAIGRLGDISLAFEFLDTEDPVRAREIAEQIRGLNEERKTMTEVGAETAYELINNAPWKNDNVLLVYLPNVHESVVGIIAGRIKELYARPTLVFTDSEDGFIKGSGRSVPAYDIMEGLNGAKDLLHRFGGHKMAAGLALRKENLELLRKRLNEQADLDEEKLTVRVDIDMELPLSYVSETLVSELNLLEPVGSGNAPALFARKHFRLSRIRIVGKNGNVMLLTLSDGTVRTMEGVLYGNPKPFLEFLSEHYGEETVKRLQYGYGEPVDVALTFIPSVNEYRGVKNMQILVENYCVIQ